LGKVVGKGTPTLSLTRFAEYRRGFDQATIYANGEDYRAGATIDFAHDPADAARARLSHGRPLERKRDRLLLRRSGCLARGSRRRARPRLDCGHLLAEERRKETAAEPLAFLVAAE
jgi:hypothetical protein